MDNNQLEAILSQLSETSVLVLGDYFLDKYLLLDPSLNETSLETGLIAYQATGKRLQPGAAGTVVNNLISLGIGKIISLGVVADDGEGYELVKCLKNAGVDTGYLIKTTDGVTPSYIKPMLMNQKGTQELNRIDIKNRKPISAENEALIIQWLQELSGKVDAVVILDQVNETDCGVVTARVRDAISDIGAKNEDLVMYADSRHYITGFRNIIVKCNQYELVRAFYPDIAEEPDDEIIIKCGKKLTRMTRKPVYVTLGSRGQFLFENDGYDKIPPVLVEGPLDITGAGDATSAGIVSALCCGTGFADAALLGNIVASITIQQIGTTGISTPQQVTERFNSIEIAL